MRYTTTLAVWKQKVQYEPKSPFSFSLEFNYGDHSLAFLIKICFSILYTISINLNLCLIFINLRYNGKLKKKIQQQSKNLLQQYF